jgi:DNA-binding MarR family transcriptional regulator
MTETISFSETVRVFMDLLVSRSMRGWKRFARDTGLSMQQFSIIMQLHYRGPCSVSDIGDRFETTSAAASQLAEKLVQSGYLERTEDPNDRRTRMLSLSPKGRDLIEQGMNARYDWVDGLVSHLSPEEMRRIAEALELMAGAAQQLDPV